MPPWPPGPRSPAYVGEAQRTLTASERATILSWVAQWSPCGRPGAQAVAAAAPWTCARASACSRSRCRRPTDRRHAGGATDDYRCFLLDPKLAGGRLGDVGTHRAGRVEDRPPRDPLPHLALAGRRGEEAGLRRRAARAGRASAGPGSVRTEAAARHATRSTTRTGSAPGRRAGPAVACRTAPASRFRRVARS